MVTHKIKIEFLLLKKEGTKCNSVSTLKSLLSSDSTISFNSSKIKVGRISATLKASTGLIADGKDERYFLLTIEKGYQGKKEQKAVEGLIEIFKKIKQIIFESEKGFKIAPLWDDTSFYYSKLAHPAIFEIENMMRKLIYKFMLTKLGSSWYKNAVPQEFKKNIPNKEAESSNNYFEEILYKADFIHVISFLFGKYTGETSKILENILKAKKIEELSLDELKQIVPQDNWTKYFSQIIKHNKFKEEWEKLYDLRCKIAHNRLINKGDYDTIINLSDSFREKLEKAISSLDKIKIEEEDKKELSQSAINSFSDLHAKSVLDWNLNSSPTSLEWWVEPNKKTNIPGLLTAFTSDNNMVDSSLIWNNLLLSERTCSNCGKSFHLNLTTVNSNLINPICEECKRLLILSNIGNL